LTQAEAGVRLRVPVYRLPSTKYHLIFGIYFRTIS
jgi:hypothetical protein